MKITALMVVINEEDYVYYALEAVHKVVDEIIIVEGAAPHKFASDAVDRGIVTPNGLSGDKTQAEIDRFLKYASCPVKYHQIGWTSSVNKLRQLSLDYSSADIDYCLILDADTVYKMEEIQGLRELVTKYPFIGAISAINLMFFRSMNCVLTVNQSYLDYCHYVDSGFFWKKTPLTYFDGHRPFVQNRKYESTLDQISLEKLPYHTTGRDVYVYKPMGIFTEFHYGWVHTPNQMTSHLLRWAHATINRVKLGEGNERMRQWCNPIIDSNDEDILEYYRTYHKLWTGIYDETVGEHLEEFNGVHPEIMNAHPYFGKSAEDLGWII